MKTKPESKSISPEGIDPLSIKCPHCAVAAFLTQWDKIHPGCDKRDLIDGLVETICDIVVLMKDKRSVGPLLLQAFLELGTNGFDIVNGEYKKDAVDEIESNEPTERRH